MISFLMIAMEIITTVIVKTGYHGNADRTHYSDQSMDFHSANDKKTTAGLIMSG
jgi:hypothetical protein